MAELRVPASMHLCALTCALTLASCNATDLVARSIVPGAGDDGGATCEVAECGALATRDTLCRSAAALVQAGDSCSASGASVSSFALCTCTDLVELVTTGTTQIYGSVFVRRAAPGGELHLHYDDSASMPVSCSALP